MSDALTSMRECAEDALGHAASKFAAIAPMQLDAAAKWAAVAQVEQSKRIADALERIADALEAEGGRSELAESVAIFGTERG